MSHPEYGRRVQASDFIKPSGLEADSGSVPPPILMNQRHPRMKFLPAINTNQPYLHSKPLPALPYSSDHEAGATPRQQLRNRNAVIVNGILIDAYVHQAHDYRAIPFAQSVKEIPKRKVNVLTKVPPSSHVRRQLAGESRYGSRDAAVSGSAAVVRLEEEKQGEVAEPLARGAFAVLENREWPPQHPEMLAIPRARAFPVITITRPTPPVSSASSLRSQTARGSRDHPYQTAGGFAIPPRRHHAIRTRAPIATLSPEQTYKAEDEREGDPAVKLQRDYVRAITDLKAERQERAVAEEQVIFLRARASQKGAYGAHYQMLWEREKKEKDTAKKETESLQKQLEGRKTVQTFEAGRDDEVSPVRSETPGVLGASVNLPSISRQRNASVKASVCRQASLKHSASILPQSLRSSQGRPRQENLLKSPRFVHEPPATASQQVLHPAAELADESTFPTSRARHEKLLQADDDWVEPSSYFSDDSDTESEMDESADVEEWANELPASTLSGELPSSPSSRSRYSNSTIDLASTPTSPSSATYLPELDSSPSLDDTESESESESEGSPRPPEAIFRFDERRIQAVPAVFRIPIPKAGPATPASVGWFDDEARIMESWEWSSVPDLSLRDFGS